MRARWALPALVLVVVAGCGGGGDPEARPALTTVPLATLPMSSEAQFAVAARQAGLEGGSIAEVVAVGEQACDVLDDGLYDVDSASERFGSLVGDRMDARAFFEAAVEHLCPEHSDLL